MAGYDTLVALVVHPNARGTTAAALRCRRVQKVRAAIICTTTHPPRHILQSCTRETRKHLIFPTWSTKCFPQTISASNNLHRVCLRFQLTSRWEMKEVLFSIGNEKTFLVATPSSSIWSRPDLEMQFQTFVLGSADELQRPHNLRNQPFVV